MLDWNVPTCNSCSAETHSTITCSECEEQFCPNCIADDEADEDEALCLECAQKVANAASA